MISIHTLVTDARPCEGESAGVRGMGGGTPGVLEGRRVGEEGERGVGRIGESCTKR